MITNERKDCPASVAQNVVVDVEVQLQRFGTCDVSQVITFEPEVKVRERLPHIVEPKTVVDEVIEQPAGSLFWT